MKVFASYPPSVTFGEIFPSPVDGADKRTLTVLDRGMPATVDVWVTEDDKHLSDTELIKKINELDIPVVPRYPTQSWG